MVSLEVILFEIVNRNKTLDIKVIDINNQIQWVFILQQPDFFLILKHDSLSNMPDLLSWLIFAY